MDANKLYCYRKYLTLRAAYHYWKEVLNKSIGACTNNPDASTYKRSGKDIASKALFFDYKVCLMLNGKIDIGTK